MAQTAFPMSNSHILKTEDWSKIAGNWTATGVIRSILNELLVYADSTGMQVKVKSGAAFIRGIYYESDSEVTLPIGAANSTNPRIDYVIVRLDLTMETVQLAVLQGVAAVTPSAPTLTQNSSRWEIALARVTVDANAVTITASKVGDERTHVGTSNPYITLTRNIVTVSSANTLTQIPFNTTHVVNSSGFTVGTNEIFFKENGMYFVEINCNMSGINSDQTGEVLIRRYLSNVNGDFSAMYRGASGQGGNEGGVPIRHSLILPCLAGGKIQFFARFSEAPRVVNSTSINLWKVANL